MLQQISRRLLLTAARASKHVMIVSTMHAFSLTAHAFNKALVLKCERRAEVLGRNGCLISCKLSLPRKAGKGLAHKGPTRSRMDCMPGRIPLPISCLD